MIKKMFTSFIMQVILFSFLSLIVASLVLKSFFSTKSHKNLPPSPRKLPLLGNLHQLGTSPHRALRAMAQTHGLLMLIHIGSVPVLIASTVDTAKEILKTHDLTFASRPHLRMPHKLLYASKNIGFAPYGEYWRQVKSIAVVHLLSNKRVQSYQKVREDEMGRMMEKIQKANGSVVNLSELIIALTNNVVCRVVLGRSYEERKFKNLLGRMIELLICFSVGTYIPWLRWVDRLTGLDGRADQVAKEFDDFLEEVIEEHVNKKGTSVEGDHDLLDVLLELQRENDLGFCLERDMVKAIILDLFLAGTETTYTTLEWAISELLSHPQEMKELQHEVIKIGQGSSMIIEEDLGKMDYLKSILKETLRIHPPAPILVPHTSTQDVKVLGYDIPSGTQVLVNAWAISMDSSNWEQPDLFMPRRFMDSSIDYNGLHFEFIPFGAGRRRCPGIQFGMIINEFVIANLVYKFDLALVGDEGLDMSETDGVAVQKKNPILVSATPRS